MKSILLLSLVITMSCSNKNNSQVEKSNSNTSENLIAILDTTWQTEQIPIRLRDSIGRAQGFESEAFKNINKPYYFGGK